MGLSMLLSILRLQQSSLGCSCTPAAGRQTARSAQGRSRLKVLEDKLEMALHQRLAASGGDRVEAANLEWRAASKAVWKERK